MHLTHAAHGSGCSQHNAVLKYVIYTYTNINIHTQQYTVRAYDSGRRAAIYIYIYIHIIPGSVVYRCAIKVGLVDVYTGAGRQRAHASSVAILTKGGWLHSRHSMAVTGGQNMHWLAACRPQCECNAGKVIA